MDTDMKSNFSDMRSDIKSYRTSYRCFSFAVELNSLLKKVPPATANPIQATSIGNIGISATKSDACTQPPTKKIAFGYSVPTQAIAASGYGAYASGFNPPVAPKAQVITPSKVGISGVVGNPYFKGAPLQENIAAKLDDDFDAHDEELAQLDISAAVASADSNVLVDVDTCAFTAGALDNDMMNGVDAILRASGQMM
jgi:hypothetical protein